MKSPLLIGITGGSGCGKTTIVNKIFADVPEKSIGILEQDSYYKEQSHLSFEEKCKNNYDHPLAFDTDLFLQHLGDLKQGKAIQKPLYDYEIHDRIKETVLIEPKDIIIVEGLFIFCDERVRNMLDIKVFVDTDADIRLIRRIRRDVNERGRTVDSIINQYITTVRPGHEQFVEPTKKYADIIVTEGGSNLVAVDLLLTKIKAIMTEN